MQLDVADLSCQRGGRTVLAGITFRLAPGEALVVTGPNGIGKSTLLSTLAGLLPHSAGRVRFDDLPGEAAPQDRIHHLGHRDGLKPALSCGENLRFARALLGPGPVDPADALARVGLGGKSDLPVAYLSAGQRRRLALARLLVSERPLWLLDEPATALDSGGQEMLAGLMRTHLSAGGLLVAATHAPLPLERMRRLALVTNSPPPAARAGAA